MEIECRNSRVSFQELLFSLYLSYIVRTAQKKQLCFRLVVTSGLGRYFTRSEWTSGMSTLRADSASTLVARLSVLDSQLRG